MAYCARKYPAGGQHAVRAWHRWQNRHCSGQRDRGCRSFPSIRPRQGSPDDGIKFGRRAEDNHTGPSSLKVDQAKIDRLMNLIGELVVSKNALPYLAQRAESQFGVRELSREIKGQYSVINRIADEMQDAIMQVRMMAVSFVFQRFPRLVRDISRKLGKEVQLVLEGEQTEADKNIIESLADPLIHIVRNSLDHGLEIPEVRLAAGKPATGKLTIRAAQEADRVVIEIVDDGKGIDPAVIKQKAYEKGIIDEAALERIERSGSDQSDLRRRSVHRRSGLRPLRPRSGHGRGSLRRRKDQWHGGGAERIGQGHLDPDFAAAFDGRDPGHGHRVRRATFRRADGPCGRDSARSQKLDSHHQTEPDGRSARAHRAVEELSIRLLGIPAIPRSNSDDELAVLLVQAGSAELGLLVDGFQETMGVIQKPFTGFLSGLSAYSGSALMGMVRCS